jgi:hypothetical protein
MRVHKTFRILALTIVLIGLFLVAWLRPAALAQVPLHSPTQRLLAAEARSSHFDDTNGVNPVDNELVSLVGQLGGPSQAVAIYGDYAYVGVGLHVVVLNIADPRNLHFVGQSDPLRDYPKEIVVVNNYAYVTYGQDYCCYTGGRDLLILDVSDAAAPRQVAVYETLGNAEHMALIGNYLYLAESSGENQNEYTDSGVRILNIENPIHPREEAFYNILADVEHSNAQQLIDLEIVEGYAYVTVGYYGGAEAGGLRVLDLTNPSMPVEVGALDTPHRVKRIVVAGDYAYLGEEGIFAAVPDVGLRVVKISDPTRPTQVGFYDVPGRTEDLTIAGNFLYVVNIALEGDGLRILDVSDPTQPRQVAIYDTPGTARGIAVVRDYAFIADEDEGLRVLNVAAPSPPQLLGSYDSPGQTLGFDLLGDYAYVADGTAGLNIVSVRNPMYPFVVGGYGTSHLTRDVAVQGNYAYVVDNRGFSVLDVTDPTHPQEIALDSSIFGLNITVAGSYAYLVEQGLFIVDISNPEEPRQVGYYPTTGFAGQPIVMGNYVYLAVPISGYVDQGGTGLHILDVSNPAAPKQVDVLFHNAAAVTVAGGYAYVSATGGLRVLDISDPAVPVEVGSHPSSGADIAVGENRVYLVGQHLTVLDTSDRSAPARILDYELQGSVAEIALLNENLYLAFEGKGVDILDVAEVSGPQSVSAYDLLGSVNGLAITSNYVYAVDGDLRVINVTDPGTPQLIGTYRTPGIAMDVETAADIAYVADGDGGLQIIDVSNPLTPTLLGSYDTPREVQHLALLGNVVFLLEGNGYYDYTPSMLHIIDVGNPASPMLLNSQTLESYAGDVTTAGNLVYVSAAGLHVFDVSNPNLPIEVGTYPAQNVTFGIAVSGNYVYLNQIEQPGRNYVPAGLYIIDVSKPTTPSLAGFYKSYASLGSIVVSRSYAFITGFSSLSLFNVANPYLAQPLGWVDLPDHPVDIKADDHYLYIANSLGGFIMLDSPDTEAPFTSANYLPLLHR